MIAEKIIFEIIGWVGSISVLASYTLNIMNKLSATSKTYLWANIFGSIFLALNTYYNHAFPSAFLNVIWAGIAIWGISKNQQK